MNPNIIHLCTFCGEKTNGKLCPSCKTKEKRKEVIKAQLEVNEEHRKKGYTVPVLRYGGKFEKQLLTEYKI